MDSSSIRILDGGMGTELSEHPCAKQGDPLWSARFLVENPAVVAEVHKKFVRSGATVISSCSYQASIQGLQEHLKVTPEEAGKIVTSSVEVAHRAVTECLESTQQVLIAGSVGPYGAYLADGSEYNGNYADKLSLEELRDWHRPRVTALINGECDLLAFETIPSVNEALALIKLLREFPDTKAWVSFCCQDSQHTAKGEKLNDAISKCCQADSSEQILCIGVNCCPPNCVEPLLKSVTEPINLPFIVYPNSGESYSAVTGWSGERLGKPLSSYVGCWLAAGARWVGGCCRTSPEDIAGIAEAAVRVKY